MATTACWTATGTDDSGTATRSCTYNEVTYFPSDVRIFVVCGSCTVCSVLGSDSNIWAPALALRPVTATIGKAAAATTTPASRPHKSSDAKLDNRPRLSPRATSTAYVSSAAGAGNRWIRSVPSVRDRSSRGVRLSHLSSAMDTAIDKREMRLVRATRPGVIFFPKRGRSLATFHL
nr:hypothetical protein [Fodinicola feengrottensis]